jgi:uncharacterized protein (DUF4415 family)
MRKASIKTNSIKTSARTRRLYEQRDKSLDQGDPPQLPPEVWAKGTIGKFYRPLKTAVSVRIDNDVIAWLKSKGDGHLTRINAILRSQMEGDLAKR